MSRTCPSARNAYAPPALRLTWILALLSLASGARAQTNQIPLPIEVYGDDRTTVKHTFELRSATGVDELFVEAHRLAYRDASTNPDRGAKGSVRLNGGPWMRMYNGNPKLRCLSHEEQFGCLSGAYHTVRFLLPVDNAREGKNTIEFRFNKTDGFSNGYRVLKFNLRADGEGQLPRSAFTSSDKRELSRPFANEANRKEGERLWLAGVLRESPLDDAEIKATCGDCHATDGIDLKYYNYSNTSIVTRAQFHGLTEKQGKQIATYIRALDIEAPPRARPWNPPFQPGPGLDHKPLSEWAAGAGRGAVLRGDARMSQYLFPKGTSASRVNAVADVDGKVNVREMPISLLLPDWNDWLPDVHPKDALPGKLFERHIAYRGKLTLEAGFAEVEDAIRSGQPRKMAKSGDLHLHLNRWANAATNFPNAVSTAAIARGVPRDVARRGLSHWGSVRTWELQQRYLLAGHARRAHGERAERRSWMTQRRNVFENAPHRIAVNKVNYPHQSVLVGKTSSTAWYQLQLTINPGDGRGINLWPVDWNYQPNHIAGLHRNGGPGHGYRYVASHLKMLQQYNDGDPLDLRGTEGTAMGLRQIHIWRYAPGTDHGNLLSELPDDVRRTAVSAMLNGTLDVLEQYEPGDWPRGEALSNTVEPENHVLDPDVPVNRLGNVCHGGNYATCWYNAVREHAKDKLPAPTINRLVDWGEAMWPHPKNDWDALRPGRVFKIRARGVAGGERLRLRIGDAAVKTFTLGSAMRTFTYTGPEVGAVRLAFDDELGVGYDVQVDYLEVDGKRMQAEAQAVNTGVFRDGACGRGGYSEWLHCRGYILFALVRDGENVAYVVRARALLSDARMQLSIGDAVVEEWTVRRGEYRDYAYTGKERGVLRVHFVNDDDDRDLQVDYLSVNRARRQAEAQKVNTAAFDRVCGGGEYSELLHCNGYVEFGPGSGGLDGRDADPASVGLVSAWPNPVHDYGEAEFSVGEGFAGESAEVRLLDAAGREVWRETVATQVGPNRVSLPSARWPNGVYLLRVSGVGPDRATRVVVQH